MGSMIVGAVLFTVLFWFLIDRSYSYESPWMCLNGIWLGALLGAFISVIVGAFIGSYPGNFEVYKQDTIKLRPIKDNYYSIIEHQNGGDVYYFRQLDMPDHITMYKPAGMIKEINYTESKDGILYENYYRYKSAGCRAMLFNTEGIVPSNNYTLEVPKGSIIYGK